MRAVLLSAALASALVLPAKRRVPLRRRVVVRGADPAYDAAKAEFLAEPQFDPLSARAWRRETLVRYGNANQSEPLRILISALLALALAFGAPLADSVGAERLEGPALYGSYGVSAASGALFLRERGRRTKKLIRVERECAVSDLGVVLRSSAKAFPGAGKAKSLRELRNEYRVVAALCADEAAFAAFGREAEGLRRRLESARVVFVPVYGDRVDASAAASPRDPAAWRRTFSDLLTKDADAFDEGFEFERRDAAWFALSFGGRSVGSGVGAPDFVEILGSLFPPRDVILAPDPPLDGGTPLGAAQKAFYDALRAGDVNAMRALFADVDAAGVSDALAAGARLDPWTSQLKDGARPSDLLVGDGDEADFGLTATTTAIEETGPGQTLLATQKWAREDDTGAPWRLVSHETIPFAPGTTAGAVLKCDARGCVALTRAQQGRQ